MKKKVGVLHCQIPYADTKETVLVKNLVYQLKKRGYDADLISMPFQSKPEDVLYRNMLMWRLVDIEESNGEKIDLIIATGFPNYAVEHPNKVCWLTNAFGGEYVEKEYLNRKDDIENEEIREKILQFERMSLRSCNKVYTLSQQKSICLKARNNIDSVPLYYPPALDGKYYCGEYGEYLLAFGRPVYKAKAELLLKVLQDCNPAMKMVIAGVGAECNTLRQLAVQIGVSERVKIWTDLDEAQLLNLYANAFGVCSLTEDSVYDDVILEALLSKKPFIILAEDYNVADFVETGDNGFVCTMEKETIARRLDGLFANRSSCKEMGMTGYQKVKDISWDRVIDTLTMPIR